jgi:predicted acyltransferase
MSVPKPRFLSLDVFRGATVCLMIIVNTSTGTGTDPFPWLVHARWIGFTAADWVFPTFLFVVGNSMSFGDAKAGGEAQFLGKVAKRTAILFLLGFLLYWYPFFRLGADGSWAAIPLGETRVTGVLQRIALAFCLSAIAIRHLPVRALYAACAVLLLGYWAILMHWGTPGEELTKLGNAGTHFDLWLVGQNHLYRKDGGFDPEGLLGVLPSVVNVLAGYLAGRVLREGPDRARSVRVLLAAGAVLVALALAWAPLLPIAKKLWTSSYVTLTVGLDLIVLAALVWLIEIRQVRAGTRFFEIFGRNPLALYLLSELLTYGSQALAIGPKQHLYDWIATTLFLPYIPGPIGVLLFSTAFMLVCWSVGYLLDRRGIVVKI